MIKSKVIVALLIIAVCCTLLSFSSCDTSEGEPKDTGKTETSATPAEHNLIQSRTIPSGYLELTVSPAEVYVNIGEEIEIRCTIESLVNTPVEITSVESVVFDSAESLIREQAMTKDSYWSAHTSYTIVGDEAYYRLRVNFTTPYAEPGEYSEFTEHSFPIVVNQGYPDTSPDESEDLGKTETSPTPEESISDDQIRSMTTPSGYLELTVSPAEVYAGTGEAIEIRCTIYSLVNTPVEITSVEVVVFDSGESLLREQAMTMDSHWSAHTEYIILGDEAYYRLKVNFTTPYAEPGEYSEYTDYSFPIVGNHEGG